MPFFGNPLELLLIVVIALIVFGPAKLPEIMAQVGRAISEFRRTTSALSEEFNRTMQAELQEGRAVLDETKAAVTEAHAAVTDVHATVNATVTGMPAPTRVAGPGELVPVANGTGAEPYTTTTTNGTSPEPISPPLAAPTPWSWETSASPTTPPSTPALDGPATPAAEVSPMPAAEAQASGAPAQTPPADAAAPSATPPPPAAEVAEPAKPVPEVPGSGKNRAAHDDLLPPY